MSRFVYGSLMAPEVLRALLGRVPDRVPAAVRGYRRYRIKERVYPAIYRADDEGGGSSSSVVEGEVLRGLSRRELAVLDWFEDEAYTLTRVEATFADAAAMTSPDDHDDAVDAAEVADRSAEGSARRRSKEQEEREREEEEECTSMGKPSEEYLDERVVMAYVYLDKRHELHGEWDYEAFRATHLDEYVAMCEAFREDVRDNDLPGDDAHREGGEGEEEEPRSCLRE